MSEVVKINFIYIGFAFYENEARQRNTAIIFANLSQYCVIKSRDLDCMELSFITFVYDITIICFYIRAFEL